MLFAAHGMFVRREGEEPCYLALNLKSSPLQCSFLVFPKSSSIGKAKISSRLVSIWGFFNVVRVGGMNMQYLLLIYENEKRFSQGYDEAEMGDYQAFGKEYANNIKG